MNKKSHFAFLFDAMDSHFNRLKYIQIVCHNNKSTLMAGNGFVMHRIANVPSPSETDFIHYYHYNSIKKLLSVAKNNDNIQITIDGIVINDNDFNLIIHPSTIIGKPEFPGDVYQSLLDKCYVTSFSQFRLSSELLIKSIKHFKKLYIDFAFSETNRSIRLTWEKEPFNDIERTAYIVLHHISLKKP